MKITIGRIADVVAELNRVMNNVSDNDTVEFDHDEDICVRCGKTVEK